MRVMIGITANTMPFSAGFVDSPDTCTDWAPAYVTCMTTRTWRVFSVVVLTVSLAEMVVYSLLTAVNSTAY